MLEYTMSEDGCRASIGPCKGGVVRLSIIRLCRKLGEDMPPETLDENTTLDELLEINLGLSLRQGCKMREEHSARFAEERARQVDLEQGLPPALAARVVDLRDQARRLRVSAEHADRSDDRDRERREAERLEAKAARLILEYQATKTA